MEKQVATTMPKIKKNNVLVFTAAMAGIVIGGVFMYFFCKQKTSSVCSRGDIIPQSDKRLARPLPTQKGKIHNTEKDDVEDIRVPELEEDSDNQQPEESSEPPTTAEKSTNTEQESD